MKEMSVTMVDSFMTLDNAVSVYYPLMVERPLTAIIFLSFLLLVSIALMNLVTAVIVERAIQSGNDERKLRVKKEGARRAKQCESLGFLFQEMDASGDGELQREELLNAPAIIRDRLGEVLGMGAHISEDMIPQYQEAIAQLFSVLDVDGSESLGIDEFMSGLLRVVEGSTTADRHMLVRIDKMCENIAGACGVGSKLGDAASSRAAREKKLQAVRMLFQELDTDGDGVLSRDELEVAIDPKSGAYALMRELCHPHDVADLDLGSLFEQLDTDRTGYVSLDEFHFAFRHLADFSAVKDRHLLVRIEKLVTNLASHHGLAAQHIGRERRPPSELSTDASLADAGLLRWCSPSVSKAEHISVDLPAPRLAPTPSGANTKVELRQLAATVAKLAEDQGAAMTELAANQRRLSEQVEELARRMPK